MIRLTIILFVFTSACNFSCGSSESGAEHPPADLLKYRIGDCLYFKSSDTTYGCLVVCDFSQDVAGIWYGAFYTGYDSAEIPTLQSIREGKVMGRKVESAIDTAGFRKALDGDFIIDTLFTNTDGFKLLGNISLRPIQLWSRGSMTSMPVLQSLFHQKKQIRLKPPDHYSEYINKLEKFHPEEYFEMKDFIN